MYALPRTASRALALTALILCAPVPALAQAVESDEYSIDDPKVQRRLGERVDLGRIVPIEALAPTASYAVPETSAVATGADVVVRPEPSSGNEGARYVPHMKLAYRLLPFSQIATTGVGPGADEIFHVVSLDLHPISTRWRIGLSTSYGWESGTFRQGGDAFFAESLFIGAQIPGPTFTPFFEVIGTGGFMQRSHHPGVLSTKASALAGLGLDVGTEIFMARFAYLSFAIGYMHGVNWWGRLADKSGIGTLQSMAVDTWTLKVGFGI
jgi:hypothetical protein